ncbi:nucleotidyltransferase, partial [Neisseria sp. P0016.S005]
SKTCQQSFAGYAYGQIKKARGLNKKISNPMPSEKKSILDFCHIIEGRQTVPLQYWLAQRGMEQRRVGLIKIAHARELYALFYDADGTLGYHGI